MTNEIVQLARNASGPDWAQIITLLTPLFFAWIAFKQRVLDANQKQNAAATEKIAISQNELKVTVDGRMTKLVDVLEAKGIADVKAATLKGHAEGKVEQKEENRIDVLAVKAAELDATKIVEIAEK